MMNLLFVSLGGLIGVLLRYFLSEKMASFSYKKIISITMMINLAACFLIGLFVSSSIDSSFFKIFSQSFISAFSTFSTFNYELLKNILISKLQAFMYLIVTISLSFIMFGIGIVV